jgi:hypothetical protein
MTQISFKHKKTRFCFQNCRNEAPTHLAAREQSRAVDQLFATVSDDTTLRVDLP